MWECTLCVFLFTFVTFDPGVYVAFLNSCPLIYERAYTCTYVYIVSCHICNAELCMCMVHLCLFDALCTLVRTFALKYVRINGLVTFYFLQAHTYSGFYMTVLGHSAVV